MSTVVPQIAAIKANQEVRPFFEANRDSIQAAIDYLTGDDDQTPDGGGGEIILQRGDYGTGQGSNAISVPPTVFINVLPGANISDITFVDTDGNTNPSTRLFRYERINDITEGIVEAIETTDGLSSTGTSQTGGLNTGVVTLGLEQNGIDEESIAPLSPQALDINIDQQTDDDFVYITATRITQTDFAFDVIEPSNIRTVVETSNGLVGDNVNTPISLSVAPENQNNVALSFDNEGVLSAAINQNSITENEISDEAIIASSIDTSETSDTGEVLFVGTASFSQRPINMDDIEATNGILGNGVGEINIDSNVFDIQSSTINMNQGSFVTVNIGTSYEIDADGSSIKVSKTDGFSIEIRDDKVTIASQGGDIFDVFDGYIKFLKSFDDTNTNRPTTADAGSGLILYAKDDGGSGLDLYQVNSQEERNLTNT